MSKVLAEGSAAPFFDLQEVIDTYLGELPLAGRASDAATVAALRAWLEKRRRR